MVSIIQGNVFTTPAIRYLLGALAIVTSVAAAEPFVEGQDYVVVSPPVTTDLGKDKVTVTEFFWYGCPHCYVLEPYLNDWKKPETIEFSAVPAVLGKQWVSHAYVYYTLAALGRLDDLHPVLFDALHNKKQNLMTLDQLAKFFSGHGIEEQKFRSVFNSFAVDTKVKAAQNLVKKYKLSSVPTITINGKYMTSPSMVGHKKLFAVIEYLVDLETKAKPRTKS